MNALARIIDANFNRAREALRVLEDVARFGLCHGELAKRIKDARHQLVAVVAELPIDGASLLASRDVTGDVGTAITSPGEFARAGLASIARANGARLGEALRSMEEAAKACGARGAAEKIEALRYEAYGIEKRVVAAFGTGRARQWRLCVLITESLCVHHPWERVAAMAMDGGADCLQLREKSLADGELLRRARSLVKLARPRSVSVVINDRADIALLAGADGVHVGQTDLSVADVREIAGGRLLVGVSTSNMTEAREAARSGADYCGVGPMFATTTKDKPVLAGPGYLREYVAEPETARVPHLAIGGVTGENVSEIRAAGGKGVAVCAAVCGAEDPARACAALLFG